MSNHIIKTAREQSGKTQAQVAKEVGISEVGYQKYEYAKRTPTAPIGNSIAKALGTTSEKLFGYFTPN